MSVFPVPLFRLDSHAGARLVLRSAEGHVAEIFVLEGEMHFEASNGQARHITPGSALLLEDTSGQGHLSRVLGNRAVTLAVVRLPEPEAA